MKKFLTNYLPYILLAALAYMPLFGYLNSLPIRIWDEARLAMNAYEMLHNSNFIVTYFEGKPEMWNTKPPLLIWMQVFWMKILGVNELAVRLPSAIAALLTCGTLMVFSILYLKKYWFGFIAVLVLLTSHGYIALHSTRTGDYDALLTLFTTLSGLYFFTYCETTKNKHLYLFFAFTAMAVLTKSITGLLFLPGMVLYSIIQKQFIPLLKNKHFYFGLLSFLVVAAGYYLLREMNNSGYIAAVIENELGGRYLKTLEDNTHGFWYYFDNIIGTHYSTWVLLVPSGLIIGLFSRELQIKRITLFSFLLIVTFFLVISSSQTKLEWYDVPLYPFLSILVAVFIHFIFELLNNIKWIKQTLQVNVVPFIFLFLLFIIPYQKIIDKTYKPKNYSSGKTFYEIGYYLKDAIKGKHDLNQQFLLYKGYNTHNKFYLNILNDKGVEISFKYWDNLDEGDVVFAFQHEVKKYVEDNYVHEVIKTVGNVVTYKIHGRKPEQPYKQSGLTLPE